MRKAVALVMGLVLLFAVPGCGCAAGVNTWSGGSSFSEDWIASHNSASWKLAHYVDDFKQPTDEMYIYSADITGTFSNSAADDEELIAVLVIDPEDVTLFLYEYGEYLVTGYSSSTTSFTVKMRDMNGNDTNLTANLYANGDRLFFTESSAEKVKEVFMQGGKVSFYLQNNRRKIETYLFTLTDTKGFDEAWKEMMGITGDGIKVYVDCDSISLRSATGSIIKTLPRNTELIVTGYDALKALTA